jgi:hypothetical protein
MPVDNSTVIVVASFLRFVTVYLLHVLNKSFGKVLALYFVGVIVIWIKGNGWHGQQQNGEQNCDELFHGVSPCCGLN